MMYSLIIPIYKNEANIPPLLEAIEFVETQLKDPLEVVFVVDGSPDNSLLVLRDRLPGFFARSQLICLSRNFGAFAAIRAGLALARGEYFAVLAADLQEPPDLVLQMFKALERNECDVTVGERVKRNDKVLETGTSNLFWWFYRKIIFKEIPRGGVDVFGCNRKARDQLIALGERNSSLVGLLFWIGFRRKMLPYKRLRREIGQSSWTFAKKWKYLLDSVYSFSDLPIVLLIWLGLVGLLFSSVFGGFVFVSAVFNRLEVPGFAATVLVVTFFGTLNLSALGVIGMYVWRTFENTKERPGFILMSHEIYDKDQKATSPK
jgi:polyisoprenyl-phosphate glycosyltransferase